MGTLKEKLDWLIRRKIDIVDTINRKTNYGNTTGSSKPFTGKYSDANWDNIVKEADTFYPSGFPEVICARHYNNGTLHTGMPDYVRPGVSISVTRTGVGIYRVSISLPSDLYYPSWIIQVMGGHRENNYNDPGNAGFIFLDNNSTSKVLEVRIADDATLNDGAFTLLVMLADSY